MRYTAPPFEFDNNDIRDKWVQKFRDTMNDICTRHNVPRLLLDQIKLEITDRKVGIISMGTYVAGSNEERAIKEILRAYDETFSN